DAQTRWLKFWEERGYGHSRPDPQREPFTIVIPPPNVTGALHMGHALNNTLQDILIRYHRMKGFRTLWQPGTDHAGIATQNVVERELASRGLTRHDVGRERFIELVWEWKERYGNIIINQLKRLGCSCDWSRTRFTMDEGLSEAVKEVFVRLYDEGLIYRGDYIINWCPRCHTALADLEVEHEEHKGNLYYIRYPLEEGGGFVTVATTRPETLLGDTAVAVNPEDERYGHLIGKRVVLPILKRPIPVIGDRYVDPQFGTGALKITPAHDPNDFLIGQAHGLESVKVIDETGKMNELAGPYVGMDRYRCRDQILKDLEKEGLLEKIEDYSHKVGHCYRCKTVIEPLLSKQWFVKVRPLAQEAIQAVKDGRTRIYPPHWEKVYYEWMENIKDWCVSRQIWWGHRIPAYFCLDCGEIMVAKAKPTSCTQCGSERIEQESDVLDTWFSSALWPFTTLGWPEKTPELEVFYPTSVLVTGFDILFFWVARMMMMGLHFMGEVPFRDVYIHALVRDAEGKKMSKSKGNVIDPLIVIDRFGADAFRFTLAALAAQGRDIKLSEGRIEGFRHFVNKVWNAGRLILSNIQSLDLKKSYDESLGPIDRWINTRLSEVIGEVSKAIEEYRFNDAAMTLYHFVWHEYCDWYLEFSKWGLYHSDEERSGATKYNLYNTFIAILKLLHPFMPFVTEEIYQMFPKNDESIMVSHFPQIRPIEDLEGKEQVEFLIKIISSIRSIRGEMNVSPSRLVNVHMEIPEESKRRLLKENTHHIRSLAKVDELVIEESLPRPSGSATQVIGENLVYVVLSDVIDIEKERQRLFKNKKALEKDLSLGIKKLENPDFLIKASEEVIEEVTRRVETQRLELDRVERNLKVLEEIER
ncbi:MAG: valine--tRNA ligase, partial [Desulfatiglandales bacterium]